MKAVTSKRLYKVFVTIKDYCINNKERLSKKSGVKF